MTSAAKAKGHGDLLRGGSTGSDTRNAADSFAQPTDLVHRVGEERLEGAALARRLLLESVEEVGELGVLLALREDLSESEHERG